MYVYCIYIYAYTHIYKYISPGRKSASWQLAAVVMGLKTMQRGKKRSRIVKINPKSKEKFTSSPRIFWLQSFLNFFPGMIHIVYIVWYICIHQ